MIRHLHSRDSVSVGFRTAAPGPGQSGEAHIFLTQDNNLTAKVPLRRSILQCNLQQKYRSTGKHNPQRDDGPEKGLYRLRPIALAGAVACAVAGLAGIACAAETAPSWPPTVPV